jgi:preprotein translocase subunit SecA
LERKGRNPEELTISFAVAPVAKETQAAADFSWLWTTAYSPIESKAVTTALDGAQRNVERYYADIRKQLFNFDEVLSTQRAVVYSRRRGILLDSIGAMETQMLKDCTETGLEIEKSFFGRNDGQGDNFDGLSAKLLQFFPGLLQCNSGELQASAQNRELDEHISSCISNAVDRKNDVLGKIRPSMSCDVARFLYLTQLDNLWQAHMKSMDYLKEFVVLRAYSQDDPLQVYQTEGFELFTRVLEDLRRNTVYSYFQYKFGDN